MACLGSDRGRPPRRLAGGCLSGHRCPLHRNSYLWGPIGSPPAPEDANSAGSSWVHPPKPRPPRPLRGQVPISRGLCLPICKTGTVILSPQGGRGPTGGQLRLRLHTCCQAAGLHPGCAPSRVVTWTDPLVALCLDLSVKGRVASPLPRGAGVRTASHIPPHGHPIQQLLSQPPACPAADQGPQAPGSPWNVRATGRGSAEPASLGASSLPCPRAGETEAAERSDHGHQPHSTVPCVRNGPAPAGGYLAQLRPTGL